MLRTFLILLALAFIAASQSMAQSHEHHRAQTSREALNKARAQNDAKIGEGEFALINHNNQPVTHAALKGKYTLLFFGFTRCGDECPAALSLIADVYDQLPAAKQKQLQVVMVSVDTEHDTPVVLKEYVGNFNPAFIGWTGTPAQIDHITKQFVAYYAIVPDDTEKAPTAYQVAHSAFIYLMDKDGTYIGHFPHTEKPETLLGALETTIP